MKVADAVHEQYSDKVVSEREIFEHIHRGDRIYVGTGCGEPQYLIGALIDYVNANPKAIMDAEVVHVW